MLRPETTSEKRYFLTGYDGSHERIGMKLRAAALAFSEEHLWIFNTKQIFKSLHRQSFSGVAFMLQDSRSPLVLAELWYDSCFTISLLYL